MERVWGETEQAAIAFCSSPSLNNNTDTSIEAMQAQCSAYQAYSISESFVTPISYLLNRVRDDCFRILLT